LSVIGANTLDTSAIETEALTSAERSALLKYMGPDAVNTISRLVELEAANLASASVKDYGAVGDGSTDDTDAIQEALDDREQFDSLVVPGGTYNVTKPLVLNTGDVWLRGAGNASVLARTGGFTGPVLYVGPADTPMPTTAFGGLVCLDLSDNPTWCFNLYENHWLRWDTTSPATTAEWEVLVYPLNTTGGDILSCLGCYKSDNTAQYGYSLSSPDGSQLNFRLVTTDGTFDANQAAAMTVGAWNVVRVTYDGSNIRIRVNGSVVRTLACTGTIVIPERYNVCIGPAMASWPDPTNSNGGGIRGYIASVRITKNQIRSTGASSYSAPVAKFDFDTHNVSELMNFETTHKRFYVGTGPGNSSHYHLVRKTVTGLVQARISDIKVRGGILMRGAVASYLENVEGDGGPYHINLLDNCFETKIRNPRHTGDSAVHFSIGMLAACGLTIIENPSLTPSSGDGIVGLEGSYNITGEGFISGFPRRTAVMVRGGAVTGAVTIQGLGISDEDQAVAAECGIYLGTVPKSRITMSGVDIGRNDAPAVILDGSSDASKHVFEQVSLALKSGGTANVFQHVAAGTGVRVLCNDLQALYDSGHARCNTAGIVKFNTDDKSGTATVAEGDTSVAVDFTNLGMTDQPDTSYSIQLTPGANVTSWYTSKATSGFTVNVSSAAGAGGTPVGWKVTTREA
jgi:hypothetical protein